MYNLVIITFFTNHTHWFQHTWKKYIHFHLKIMCVLRPKIIINERGPMSLLFQFPYFEHFTVSYLFGWCLAELLCLLPYGGITRVLLWFYPTSLISLRSSKRATANYCKSKTDIEGKFDKQRCAQNRGWRIEERSSENIKLEIIFHKTNNV